MTPNNITLRALHILFNALKYCARRPHNRNMEAKA